MSEDYLYGRNTACLRWPTEIDEQIGELICTGFNACKLSDGGSVEIRKILSNRHHPASRGVVWECAKKSNVQTTGLWREKHCSGSNHCKEIRFKRQSTVIWTFSVLYYTVEVGLTTLVT